MTIQKWKQEYDSLKDFTAAHAEIQINMTEISIPQEFRDDFYQRFDMVREAVVEERFASLPLDVDNLSRNYTLEEKSVTEQLGLDDIWVPADLLSFLHKPKAGLKRALYNRLFELVQEKITPEEFEQMADADLAAALVDLFCLGYEPWAALALIRLFDPDKAFSVLLDEDFKPYLGELKEIAFGRQFHHVAMRIPEFVLHSKKLDRHIAVKMPLAREVETFYIPIEPPVKPRKRTGDTSYVLDRRMMFLSFVDDLDKIPVFADIHKRTIKSPDLTVEFLMKKDLADPEAVIGFRKRVEIMKPRLGGCLVVMDPGEDADMAKPAENIDVIAAGIDPSRLESIIDKLA
ncbi:MAG: hypothetical protein JXR49_13530 [Acidobacteria bacterium]|nr:hypothetical protein [Acidobacteriota bacterium]